MRKKEKNYSLSVILAFLIFIFVIGILFPVLPKKDFSETEKRYLAEFPEFSFESLASGDFTADFETYLSDHSPLRSLFVSLNSYFELLKGNNGSTGVYLGKKGWLIEKPVDRDNRLNSNIDSVIAFSEKVDAPVSMVLVPTKGSVYSEMLPANALEYYDNSYLDLASSKCGEKVDFIDLRPAFEKAKDNDQLFYRTDHHWTSAGAFTACNVIFDSLSLPALNRQDYSVESTDDFCGTSFAASCYTLTKPDSIEVWRNKETNGAAEVTITESGKSEKFENMFFTDALATGDKYVVFLNGNHAYEKIVTGGKGGRLLLIKDSFAHCAAPFLAENFSEIVMIDLRYFRKPVTEVIKDENITDIIFFYGLDTFAESRDIILK